jgi:Domain of Unknown Function (DUF748)
MNEPTASAAESTAPTPAAKDRSSVLIRWLRRAAWLLAALLVLWVLAWLVVPPLLKSQAQKIASEKLGRSVTIGAIDFKPWTLELAVSDLTIAKQGAPATATGAQASPGTPQISIKRIYIDAEMESLLRLAPVADAIQIDEPVVSLMHLGDGRYDIDDILERLKSPADKPPGEPPQFALYNLNLTGGRVDFTDQSVKKTHELRELTVSVPFLSNLQSQREIKTSPRLAFKLNGSGFDTAAEATPFAQTRKTDATIKLSDFDLKPYLGYLPASLPYRLQGALLNADVKVAFEQTPATVVKLSGTVTATQVRLQEAARPAGTAPAGPDLLAFDRLQLTLDDVRPLEQIVKISKVELTAPRIHVTRNRAGQLNLLPPAATDATKNGAAGAGNTGASGQNSSKNGVQKPSTAPPWKVTVASVAVRDGKLTWLDETLASPAQIALANLSLDASRIAVPFVASAPLEFKGSLALDPASLAQTVSTSEAAPRVAGGKAARGKAKAAAPATASASAAPAAPPATTGPAQLNFSGTATDQVATVTADLVSWPLKLAAKYVGQFLLPALDGQLDAQLGLNWQAAAADKPQALQVTSPQLALSNVQLAQGKTSLVSVKRIEVSGADIDVAGQSFKAAKLQLTEPKALVERGTDKSWMYERWMVGRGTPTASVKPAPEANAAKPAPSWAVAINDVGIDNGAMSFSDKAAGSKPVAFEVSALKAQLGNLVLDDRKASPQGKAPMPLTASLKLSSGRFEPGKVDFKGNLGLGPVQTQGQLLVSRLPVQAFEPYFADTVNIELLRADASFKGKVAYKQTAAGPQAQVAGDVALEEFKANTLAPSEDLLAWKALSLRGLSVALEPAKATRIDVKETVLTDFFARVIVTPEGRINLQDLLKKPGQASAAAAPPPAAPSEDATKTIAARAGITAAAASNDLQSAEKAGLQAVQAALPGAAASAPAPGPAPAATSAAAASGPAPIVNFGPLSLINGKVLFSDRFIKPNYSANLTELTGKLSAFSSEAPKAAVPVPGASAPAANAAPSVTPTVNMADLELRGRAEGTASLEILGKLNPLAKPLALDITGKVRDLELPPLSPYAIKYAGYGINRGKMSVDVNYIVLPSGQLTAKNKLVLNQLTFGDKVEGAPASLPVKLAVALLADRNGVIDLDLPISGSLNDPQFSLGPIIIKVILNVIVKAITAPFSLLANAFGGGGNELSSVSFAAGSTRLAPDAKAGLDKVAKALTDRPALKLTVVGTSNLDAERDGFKRERLDELVRAEKRRVTVKEGGTTSADITISPAEYPALLKEVYKRADMPKPRNVVGLAKDLPENEMEKLLLADIKVSDDAMRELAVQRGVVVKDYLAAANLPADRLFLGASKTAAPDPKWTPRAELNLASP